MGFFKSKKIRLMERKKRQQLKIQDLEFEATLLQSRAKVEKLKTTIAKARRGRSVQEFRTKVRTSDKNFKISDRDLPTESADDRLRGIF